MVALVIPVKVAVAVPVSTLAAPFHVASPAQKVEAVAPVPLFKLATGRLPVTPVLSGNPVALVSTAALGVPKAGVTNVGLVESTVLPVPVLVVTPVPPFATGSVPVTPVVRGRPVAFVNTTALGVPNAGVTNVGLVERTLEPDPVLLVTPVPPLATGSVPDTPLASGTEGKSVAVSVRKLIAPLEPLGEAST